NSSPFALIVVFDITAFTGTTIAIQPLLVDPVSGKKLLYGAAFPTVAATGTKGYIIGPPGVAAAAGDIAGTLNFPAPSFWAFRLVPVAVTNITATFTVYSVPLLN